MSMEIKSPHDQQMENLLITLNRSYDQSGGEDAVWTPQNLDKYPDLTHEEIANALIDNKDGELVASQLDLFQNIDHKKIAERLIETGQGIQVKNNLDKFNLDDDEKTKIMEMLDKN